MIREMDGVSLAFSLWEQARKDLAACEDRLHVLRRGRPTMDELEVLDAEIALLRVKTDRLLGQAIDALREHSQRLQAKRDPSE